MKKSINLAIFCLALISLFSFSKYQGNNNIVKSELNDTSSLYINGTYQGYSQSVYTGEPYWGHVQISVDNGSFSSISFVIRDSSTHEFVDSMYGVIHYQGNPGYMQQCVNDGHGIESYPQKLIEVQNLDNVDGISGATWSYNIFKATVKDALKSAKKPTSSIIINKSDDINIIVSPNPFCSSFTFEYTLMQNCSVNLSIYDNHGKLLKLLLNQEQETGNYSLKFTDLISAGIYYYRLQTDNKITGGKLIKLEE
jgi:major membrane immunogen (membrane-anchored lipoprotein)